MKAQSARAAERGFTLLEVIVVMAILGIAAAIAIPALDKMIVRSQLLTMTRETATLMQAARMESVRRGFPVVVRMDWAADEVYAFLDVDDDGVWNGALPAVERILGRLPRPRQVAFLGVEPGGCNPDLGGEEAPAGTSVVGFTAPPDPPGDPNQAVFERDGSIRDVGAFRFADRTFRNFLEVNVEPQATARVAVRKCSRRTPLPVAGVYWYESGLTSPTGTNLWEWY